MKKARNHLRLVRSMRVTLRAKKLEIFKLREALELDRRLLRSTSSKLRDLEDELAEAKRIVGHSSILFETARREPRYSFGFKAGDSEPRIDVTSDPGSFSRSALGAELAGVPLKALLWSVKEEFSGAVHCFVRLADGEVAYAMTPGAVRRTPRDIMIRRISEELAYKLVDTLKGKK